MDLERALLLGAFALGPLDTCLPQRTTEKPFPSEPSPSTRSVEETTLDEARKLCAQGDCQTGHERLQLALPPNSPMRQSPTYQEFENRWAASVVNGAENDPDIVSRRRQLDEVAESPVDPTLRTKAKAKLARLAAPAPPVPQPTPLQVAKEMVAAKETNKARQLLLLRVLDGAATKQERDYLTDLCKKLKDKACLSALKPPSTK